MTLLKAIILGIIQGISEFLPISSSGHLALFQNILDVGQDNLLFDVVLHVGTLVPVFIVFWKEILIILKKPVQKMTGLLIAGTVPAVVAALFFKDGIESLFQNVRFLMLGFTFTGLILLYADRVKPERQIKDAAKITYPDALAVGVMQAVAIAPSISRSGSTIAASLFRKMDRETAARFSFLLSIPAILGAAVLQAKDVVTGGVTVGANDALCMAAGFVAAALSGWLAISFMLSLIKKAKLKYFSLYLFVLAVFIFVDTFILNGAVFG